MSTSRSPSAPPSVRVLADYPGPTPIVVVRAEGSLGRGSGRMLRRRLRRLSRRYPIVCLDLRGLEAMEAEAEAAIAHARARAGERGRRLVAFGAPSAAGSEALPRPRAQLPG